MGVLQERIFAFKNRADAQRIGLDILNPLLIGGPIVRVQPNHISFNTVKAIEDIHGIHTTARKGLMYEISGWPGMPAGLFSETFSLPIPP
jgi:hypothetical protein